VCHTRDCVQLLLLFGGPKLCFGRSQQLPSSHNSGHSLITPLTTPRKREQMHPANSYKQPSMNQLPQSYPPPSTLLKKAGMNAYHKTPETQKHSHPNPIPIAIALRLEIQLQQLKNNINARKKEIQPKKNCQRSTKSVTPRKKRLCLTTKNRPAHYSTNKHTKSKSHPFMPP